MKRMVAAVVLALWLAAPPAAQTPVLYTFEEAGLRVTAPAGLLALTRDAADGDETLAYLGLEAAALREDFAQSGVYLNLLSLRPFYEITLTAVDAGGAPELWAGGGAAAEAAAALMADTALGYTGWRVSLLEGGLFLVLDFARTGEDGPVYGRQYHTVRAGRAVSLTLTCYEGEATSEQLRTLRQMVQSLAFTGAAAPGGQQPAPLLWAAAGVLALAALALAAGMLLGRRAPAAPGSGGGEEAEE